MKNDEMKSFIENLQGKLGEDNSSLIADDLGKLMTDNSQMNSEIENKNKEISSLKNDKEMLIKTNGSLLQQVSMGIDVKKLEEEKQEKDETQFSFSSAFDKKGNFI